MCQYTGIRQAVGIQSLLANTMMTTYISVTAGGAKPLQNGHGMIFAIHQWPNAGGVDMNMTYALRTR